MHKIRVFVLLRFDRQFVKTEIGEYPGPDAKDLLEIVDENEKAPSEACTELFAIIGDLPGAQDWRKPSDMGNNFVMAEKKSLSNYLWENRLLIISYKKGNTDIKNSIEKLIQKNQCELC